MAFPVFVLLSLACLLLFRQLPHWKQAAGAAHASRRRTAGRDRAALPLPAAPWADDGNLPEAAPVLLGRHGPGWSGWSGSSGRSGRTADGAGEEMVRLVRELSALLAGGRSGSHLWADVISARTAEIGTPDGPISARAGPSQDRFPGHGQTAVEGPFIVAQLRAAHRAAQLGLSPSSAIRRGCVGADSSGMANGTVGAWQGLAACLDVAETSGAPLADVLLRFAAQLEGNMDTAAMRETALAGPKATVRLLTWLPVLGLGLGTLMGVDPLSILFGGPVGWLALLAGAGLMAAGRYWSQVLIHTAAQSKP